jgi:hypothetical protein
VGDRHSQRASILGKAAANVLNARQAQLGSSGIEPSENIIRNIADQHVTHDPMISHDIIGSWCLTAILRLCLALLPATGPPSDGNRTRLIHTSCHRSLQARQHGRPEPRPAVAACLSQVRGNPLARFCGAPRRSNAPGLVGPAIEVEDARAAQLCGRASSFRFRTVARSQEGRHRLLCARLVRFRGYCRRCYSGRSCGRRSC